MNDYNADSNIAKFARQLVAEFGAGWSIDIAASYVHGVFIDGPDVRLYVRDLNLTYTDRGSHLGKVEITGSVPAAIPTGRRNEAGAGLEWGQMKVSATRPIDQIRDDIERRILATARKAHAAVLAGETRAAAHRAARHAVRDQLTVLLPDPRIHGEDEDSTRTDITTYAPDNSNLRAEWSINRDGSQVNVKLEGLTPSQARQIAVLLYPKIA